MPLRTQRNNLFFYGGGPVSAAFYLANHCKPAELIATFDPHNPPDAAKLTLPRYQIEGRNVHLDLNLRAYGRAARREDKHAAETCVSAVPNIVVFCAVGPSKEDRQD